MFNNSFALVRQSWAVLKQDKELLWFPVLSGVSSIIIAISFLVPGFAFVYLNRNVVASNNDFQMNVVYYIGLFFFYLVSFFSVTFFNTALITCAYMRLQGQNPTFKDGINGAMNHLGKIFIWAFISATFGLVLKIISDKSNLIGKILASLMSLGWSLLTFFIVPVLIFENKSVIDSIKQSGIHFKNTWGENIVGQVSMSLFFILVGLLGAIPLIVGIVVTVNSISESIVFILMGFTFMIFYWMLLGIVGSALDGIFKTALYVYATTGKISPEFDPELIRSAFKSKDGAIPSVVVSSQPVIITPPQQTQPPIV